MLDVDFWILIWKLSAVVIFLPELWSKKYYLLLKQHLVNTLRSELHLLLPPLFFSHYMFQNSTSNTEFHFLVHTLKFPYFASFPCYGQIYCFNFPKRRGCWLGLSKKLWCGTIECGLTAELLTSPQTRPLNGVGLLQFPVMNVNIRELLCTGTPS